MFRRIKEEARQSKGLETPPLRLSESSLTTSIAVPDREHVYRDNAAFNTGTFSVANFTSAVHALSYGSDHSARSLAQIHRIPSADETLRKYWPSQPERSDFLGTPNHFQSINLPDHPSQCNGHILPPAWFTPVSFTESGFFPENTDESAVHDSRLFRSGSFNPASFSASVRALSTPDLWKSLATESVPQPVQQPAERPVPLPEPLPVPQPPLNPPLPAPVQFVKAATDEDLEIVNRPIKNEPKLAVEPPVKFAQISQIIPAGPLKRRKRFSCW